MTPSNGPLGEAEEVLPPCTALCAGCARKDILAQGGPQAIPTLPPGRGSQVPGASVLRCLLQNFQEEMSSSSVLNKGARGWWCKRGSQHGILMGQPGAAGSPRSSISPFHWRLETLCFLPEPHSSKAVSACWTPPCKMLPPLSDSKTRAHFLHVPT